MIAGHSVTRILSRSLFIACCLASFAGCNGPHAFVSNQAGMFNYSRGNYTVARAEFQRAVANDPYNADYYHNMASAMRRQGDIAGAESVYRQALKVDPAHQPTYHSLAVMLKDQGRGEEALATMQTWVAAQPYSAKPYIETAWLKREMGDVTGSEELLITARRLDPQDHVAAAQLGQLYQDTNQPDRAAAMYKISLNKRWYQPEVQSRLATLDSPRTGMVSSGGMISGPSVVVQGTPTMGPQPMVVQQYQPGSPVIAAYGPTPTAVPTPVASPPPYTAPQLAATPNTPVPLGSLLQPTPSGINEPVQPVQIGQSPTPVDPAHADLQISSDLPVVAPH